jgi:hypothetical protein
MKSQKPTSTQTYKNNTTPNINPTVSGSGSQADPYRIVTVVDALGAGLRVEQTDSYVVGSQAYRTDIRITNQSPAGQTGIVYRAGDCYLQESDTGFGRVDGGAPACVVSADSSSRIEQWLPITPGSHFMEATYQDVYDIIASQQQLPDTCACDFALDNGAGLSWALSIAPGQTQTFSHETFFSPVGRAPTPSSFTSSVPDPTQISLDPIIVAQSVVIAAGVILLVPFPSALFNNTLEENYDEVMSGMNRVRAWLSRAWAALRARVSRQAASRRQAPLVAPAETSAVLPSMPPPAETGPFQTASSPAAMQPPAAMAVATADGTPSRDIWRTPQGMVGFVLLSALLYAFLDPTFGFSLVSLATLAGLAIGLAIVLLAYGLPLVLMSRNRRLSLSARALPATLIVAVICVLVSRLADFQPGYLYGLVIGFFFAVGVERTAEGRAEGVAAAVSLIVAIVAWILLAFLHSGGGIGGEFVSAVLQAATVTVVVAGLENAVFGMLPLRFMPGAAVYAWDRRVWLVLLGVGVFGFAHVLLNPSAGYMADTTRTSFLTMVVLLIGFGLASVLFWAWFRFRPKRATQG